MNRIRHLAYVISSLAVSTLVLGTPAFAMRVPPPAGWDDPAIVPQNNIGTHLAAGGMPGWQITLIAASAALLAATLAVLADRAVTARRRASSNTA
jgi:hypothetical protein